MGLMFNGHRHMPYGGVIGATLIDGACRMAQVANRENDEAFLLASRSLDPRASVPDGTRHPVAWVMPRVAGGLSARNTIIGSGGAAATAQSGYNIDATLTGSGGASGAVGLIVTIAAAIAGSGGVSAADTKALATLIATLTGAGSVTAAAGGLAELTAILAGAGAITANNTALMDIGATLRGYGEASAEGIRDAVWNALQADINNAGTAGAALLAAGSAGDPWITALPGSYPAGSAGALLAALYSGLTPEQQAQLTAVAHRLRYPG